MIVVCLRLGWNFGSHFLRCRSEGLSSRKANCREAEATAKFRGVANKSKRVAKASARGAGVLSGLKTGLIERELCVSAWQVKGVGLEGREELKRLERLQVEGSLLVLVRCQKLLSPA